MIYAQLKSVFGCCKFTEMIPQINCYAIFKNALIQFKINSSGLKTKQNQTLNWPLHKNKYPVLSTVFKHLLICLHWLSQPEACNRTCVCECSSVCGEYLIIWLYMFILIHPLWGWCEALRNQAPDKLAVSGTRNSPYFFTRCLVLCITSACSFLISHLSHNTVSISSPNHIIFTDCFTPEWRWIW